MTFGYNAASQIVTRTSSNDSYASNTAYAVSRNYSVNGLNQYTAAGTASFGYDANGNLTSDGTRTFTYDAENRLVAASGGVTLSYDPLGRLFQTAGGGAGTTQYHLRRRCFELKGRRRRQSAADLRPRPMSHLSTLHDHILAASLAHVGSDGGLVPPAPPPARRHNPGV